MALRSNYEKPAGGAPGNVALAVAGLSVAYGNVVAVHDATFHRHGGATLARSSGRTGTASPRS